MQVTEAHERSITPWEDNFLPKWNLLIIMRLRQEIHHGNWATVNRMMLLNVPVRAIWALDVAARHECATLHMDRQSGRKRRQQAASEGLLGSQILLFERQNDTVCNFSQVETFWRWKPCPSQWPRIDRLPESSCDENDPCRCFLTHPEVTGYHCGCSLAHFISTCRLAEMQYLLFSFIPNLNCIGFGEQTNNNLQETVSTEY